MWESESLALIVSETCGQEEICSTGLFCYIEFLEMFQHMSSTVAA